MRARPTRSVHQLLWALSAVLLTVSPASAQPAAPQVPAGPLTLEQVLDLAEARSESIAIARTGVTRADAERLRARSGFFPQVSASASYDRALASEFEGVFGTTTGPVCAPFALNPQAALEDRVAEIERAIDCGAVGSSFFGGGTSDGISNLPFGRENTWRGTVTVSQNLYAAGRLRAQVDLAAATREAADLTLKTARGQLLFDVTQAYYDAALSGRLVQIAEATLEQANATLRQVQAGFDAGTQPEFEVVRARVSRDNQTPALIRQRVNREIALLRLKQLLDLPPTYDLQIADALEDDTLAPPPVFAPRVASVESAMSRAEPLPAIIEQGLGSAPGRRAAVESAESDVRRSQASLSLTEAQKRPSLTLNSSYSRVAYPSGIFEGFNDWRTNWTVGASLQVPVLTGGRQRGDELAGRAQLEESRLRLQQTQELADLDTRLAWAELLAARSTWEASAGTIEQAQRAYQIADVRYRAGVSTQLELSDSRLLLQQAEANRAQAARDVQVARARVALLPDLPIGAVTSTAPRPAQPVPAAPQTPAPQPQQPAAGGFQTTSAQGVTQVGR